MLAIVLLIIFAGWVVYAYLMKTTGIDLLVEPLLNTCLTLIALFGVVLLFAIVLTLLSLPAHLEQESRTRDLCSSNNGEYMMGKCFNKEAIIDLKKAKGEE